jgi:ubiquinone/menaquinone biosynthesis C-methylase UbiE
MGIEIDNLKNYPKAKRDLTARLEKKSEESRAIARRFDKDYFDGSRDHGYGGFFYNPRYWTPVIPDLIERYGLGPNSRVLDVGCAKGFFLHDLVEQVPGISVSGLDISEYAITNSISSVSKFLKVGNAIKLPYPDNSFDFVISINTVHNLNREDCAKALQEIERVSKKDSFLTVDAYRDEFEKERMEAWNLTALTMMSCDEWVSFFEEIGYSGDYYWFIP